MPITFGILFVLIAYLATCLFTVPQRTEALITFFGKHVRTAKSPGLQVKLPWPFHIVTAKIPTDLRQVGEHLDTKTKDDLFVRLPITIQYLIVDTGRFYFDTDVPVDQMNKIVSASVRKYTSSKDFQELYTERDEISHGVIEDIREQVADYGIIIRRIVIDEPSAPQDVQDSYNRVRASEREKDAAQNEAAADYIRRVKGAEADKQRNILIGEGVAGFRQSIATGYAEIRQKLVSQGVDLAVADRFMEEAMRLDTIRDVGERGNMVIVMPSSAESTHGIGEVLKAAPLLDKIRESTANKEDATPPAKSGKKSA